MLVWIIVTAIGLAAVPPLTIAYMWYTNREYHERNDYPRGW